MSVLEPGYVQHAAPEAIEERMRTAIRRKREAAREIDALIALLRQRVEQIAAGEWPAGGVAKETAERAALIEIADNTTCVLGYSVASKHGKTFCPYHVAVTVLAGGAEETQR